MKFTKFSLNLLVVTALTLSFSVNAEGMAPQISDDTLKQCGTLLNLRAQVDFKSLPQENKDTVIKNPLWDAIKKHQTAVAYASMQIDGKPQYTQDQVNEFIYCIYSRTLSPLRLENADDIIIDDIN